VAMDSEISEIEEIQHRMSQIRRDLRRDMQGVILSAEGATDWRRLVRHYPWTTMGLVCAAGFLIVPRTRRLVLKTVAKSGSSNEPGILEDPRSGLLGSLFRAAVPLAVRLGQSYAAYYLENWIAQQMSARRLAEIRPTPSDARHPGHSDSGRHD
jgi:hypothetical protein